jgi:ketosteroid isomerase-like protein
MTLDELLAKDEIRDLRIAYSQHYDALDLDQLMTLFTEDAVCEFGSYGTWHGRDTIRTNYAAVLKHQDRPFATLHATTNPLIKITGPTTAYGRWYLIDLLAKQQDSGLKSPGGHDNPLMYLAVYEDQYRKVGGKWLIAHTKLHFLWPQFGFDRLQGPAAAG